LLWWPAAAGAVALCVLVILLLLPYRPSAQATRQTNELLSRSVAAPEPEGRLISMQFHGESVIRPAVLRADSATDGDSVLAQLEVAFTSANYSWREPLSARSFQVWRGSLPNKRDTVSVLNRQGEKQGYRVRTDSSTGRLRSVSLTLRAEDLRPTNGTFAFEREGTVESTEVPAHASQTPRSQTNAVAQYPAETLATPEDTLRVLAALNEIGADVGDPISISEDSQRRHVVVRARGLGAERRQQVAQALHGLPRVVLNFDPLPSGSSLVPSRRPEEIEATSSSIPDALRRQFEERAGGAIRLQKITDAALEFSSLILARTHAMQLLAEKFPPSIEARLAGPHRALLDQLRHRHLSALASLTTRIRTTLTPLLPSSTGAQLSRTRRRDSEWSWQSEVPSLVAVAAEADTFLNRLLAGSYAQPSGEEMITGLEAQVERLEQVIQSQQWPEAMRE
jgi:hypothetical protein